MSWAIGYDSQWNRDIGYGVPSFCDHPGCNREIDRGLGYVCGGDVYGGGKGCGLHFCGKHLIGFPPLCLRCSQKEEPFSPKPDHPDWISHKLSDPSWEQWRKENPNEVKRLKDKR